MFEQSLLPEQRSRRPWTVFAAFVGQLVLIGIVILIPLLYYQALPQIHLERMILAPPPPPPPPPPPAATPPRQPRVIQRPIETKQLVEPKMIPKHVVMLKEPQLAPEAAPATGVVGGVPGGIPGGSIGGVLGGVLGSVRAPAPPPPPTAPKPVTPQRIRVGGNVQAARLINKVVPLYPALAKQARIQGEVRLGAIIGKDGTIQQLHVISGHPLLVPAALAAVKQWRYAPTHLNGEPVEVQTEIDVSFALAQ